MIAGSCLLRRPAAGGEFREAKFFFSTDKRAGCSQKGNGMVEVDIKIEARDLYDYLLTHHYNSSSGLLGSCVGALAVIVGAVQPQWLLLILGVILLFYLPWTLFLRSKKQALNPVFQKPLHYRLDGDGITVSQGEEAQLLAWEDMVKAVSTGKSIIVYTSRTSAIIFPKRELGEQKGAVIEVISTHMPPAKVKIKE